MTEHLLYLLLWCGFGLVHSILVRPAVADRLERSLGCWHRLVFSIGAAPHLTLVLLIGYRLLGEGGGYFEASNPLRWVLYAVSLVGAGIATRAVGEHDIGAFYGWRQVLDRYRDVPRTTDSTLRIAGLYRYCRHPAYLGTLLLLWGLAQSPFGLATAVWGTVYTLIGVRFEERDLIRKFGATYRDYLQLTPMLVPRMGRGAGHGES